MGSKAGHAPGYQARFRPHVGYIVANTLFVAVFVAVVLSMFHAPSPHGLRVGIVAPAAVTGQVEQALGTTVPGGFDLHVYHSAVAARVGITRNEVDGALIAAPGRLTLLVAQAAGTAPSQALTSAFSAVAAHSGQPLTVTDMVPPLPDDSMALSPFFVILGVLFPSLAAGSASALVFRRSRPAWAVAGPAVVAVVIGAVAAGIADGVSGLGNYPAIAGIVALFSLAVAAPTAALGRIRPPLVALAILAFMVFGIPASGGPSNLAAFGPGYLRVLHSALPLGTAASAVRAAVYFGGYGVTGPVWALAAWALAGTAALVLVTARRRQEGPVPVPLPARAAAGAARPYAGHHVAGHHAAGSGALAPENALPSRQHGLDSRTRPDIPRLGGPWRPGREAAAALAGRAAGAGADGRFPAAPPVSYLIPPAVGQEETLPPVSLVVGFDDSQSARRALGYAARVLAARPGILHIVYANRAVIDSDLSGFGHAEIEAARDREAAEVAGAAAGILNRADVEYTFERRQGSPADAILAATAEAVAPEGGHPVIVVGRSGHAAHRVLGSVPVRLLHQSPYPVLTIP